MIGYVTLGTNNVAKAAAFYDSLLAELGASRFMEDETFVAWAVKPGEPGISVISPFNKEAATVGNGTMVALALSSKEQVKQMYDKALELGATDEGKPGDRGNGFYVAYFRDLDGNKLNFYSMGQA